MADGWRLTAPGWSAGEPEYSDWEQPGMLQWLSLVGDNPTKLAVSLHEYSLDYDLTDNSPYLIGRYTFLLDVCKAHNIPAPGIHITEFGWVYNDIPPLDGAMTQLAWAAEQYAANKAILGLYIWYLGAGFDGIANKVQPLIGRITDFNLNATYPDPVEVPDGLHIINVVDSLPKHSTLKYGTRPLSGIRYVVVHHEGDGSVDDPPELAARYHVYTKGWPGIGYHYWITGNGDVFQTNWLDTHSYHVGTLNDVSVGICLAGDFTNVLPTPAQLVSVNALVNWLKLQLPGVEVVPHKHLVATECPGNTSATWWPQVIAIPEQSKEQRWWDLTITEQIEHGLHLAPTALQDAVRRDEMHPVTKEMYTDGNPPMMAAEDWKRGTRPRTVYVYKNNTVVSFSTPRTADEQKWWDLTITEQIHHGLQLAHTAIQDAIRNDGMHPVTKEMYVTGEPPMMAAEDWATGLKARRVYVYQNYRVIWFEKPGTKDVLLVDGFDAPVGTATERASTKLWPGMWTDANSYGNRYWLRDKYVWHTGSDLNLNSPSWDLDRLAPVYADAHGEVTHVAVHSDWGGYIVILKHSLPTGNPVYSRFAHLDSVNVSVGQVVRRGEQIGRIGRSLDGPYHLHYDISTTGILATKPGDWPGVDYQRILVDYTDPLAYISTRRPRREPAPPTGNVDLLPYLMGGNQAYMVRHPGGAEEKFRYERDGNVFYLVKNGQWEQYRYDDAYIWRGIDTSPGADRLYIQYEPGAKFARWCPRYMSVGQTWTGPGHYVQFYNKSTCQADPVNSGHSTNITHFKAHYPILTLTASDGRQTTVTDVIVLGGEFEEFGWAKGVGLVYWKAGWGQSTIVEIGVAPDNQREVIRCNV
jgi:hypothetical protein